MWVELGFATRMPREAGIAASEAAAMPFPRETTPPVTDELGHGRQVPNGLDRRQRFHHQHAMRQAPPRAARVSSRPRSARTASIAGVCVVPHTTKRSGIIIGGFNLRRAATALIGRRLRRVTRALRTAESSTRASRLAASTCAAIAPSAAGAT